MKKLLAVFTFYFSIFNFQYANAQKEVKIGTQVWMAENLNVEKFRNGDEIPEVKSEEEWKAYADAGEAAWCYYDNDRKNGKKYVKLYNWYAVNDSRGLAPEGWHVPSDEEWTVLTDYLGGAEIAGAKMKSKSGWNKNGNGNNSSRFSGLPGGFRYFDGAFEEIGYLGGWWSSSEANSGFAWGRFLRFDDGNVNRHYYDKTNGFSVRCLRD